jgi:copper(I)-binding protein
MLRGWLITVLLLLAGPALAGVNDVMVDKVWLHETVKGQQEVSVHLTLSVAKSSRLLALSSPVAVGGEIRRFVREHGKMEKRAVESLKLPARSTVSFGMRNVDLFLTGLKQRLNEGDHVSIKLVLEVAGRQQEISVQAEVRAADLSYQQF